jgi:hypothetical protein
MTLERGGTLAGRGGARQVEEIDVAHDARLVPLVLVPLVLKEVAALQAAQEALRGWRSLLRFVWLGGTVKLALCSPGMHAAERSIPGLSLSLSGRDGGRSHVNPPAHRSPSNPHEARDTRSPPIAAIAAAAPRPLEHAALKSVAAALRQPCNPRPPRPPRAARHGSTQGLPPGTEPPPPARSSALPPHGPSAPATPAARRQGLEGGGNEIRVGRGVVTLLAPRPFFAPPRRASGVRIAALCITCASTCASTPQRSVAVASTADRALAGRGSGRFDNRRGAMLQSVQDFAAFGRWAA